MINTRYKQLSALEKEPASVYPTSPKPVYKKIAYKTQVRTWFPNDSYPAGTTVRTLIHRSLSEGTAIRPYSAIRLIERTRRRMWEQKRRELENGKN